MTTFCLALSLETGLLLLQDIPLISNIGSEFQLKPINFFTELATLDIIENDDFQPCRPKQGASVFDYLWSGVGDNYQYSKGAFTLAKPLAQPGPVPTDPSVVTSAG